MTKTMISQSDLTPEARQENSATYCPADNKLRLYCGVWLDGETVKHLDAVGFKPTPKQDCSFAATWSPAAEDACFALIADDDDIGEEDDGPETGSGTVNSERFAASACRAPTEPEPQGFLVEQKRVKRQTRKSSPKSPPLINPTDEDAERLQASWNRGRRDKGFRPTEIVRMTQARYSVLSRGAYTPFSIIEVDARGKRVRKPDRTPEGTPPPVFKIRKMTGPGRFIGQADAVVILTDKPRRPMPLDWAIVENATSSEATA